MGKGARLSLAKMNKDKPPTVRRKDARRKRSAHRSDPPRMFSRRPRGIKVLPDPTPPPWKQ